MLIFHWRKARKLRSILTKINNKRLQTSKNINNFSFFSDFNADNSKKTDNNKNSNKSNADVDWFADFGKP